MSLTFDALRAANIARMPQYKNKKGELAHSMPDGSDWTPSDWLTALVGELGEFANWYKKYKRGDMSAAEFKEEAGKELADVQIYLDILALRCLDTPGNPHATGICLGDATVQKFNEVSDRVGATVKLGYTMPVININVGDAGLVSNYVYVSAMHDLFAKRALECAQEAQILQSEILRRKHESVSNI